MTESFALDGDTKLWTVAQGQGVPVVLCSGGPGCCDYLGPVAALLDDVARVIRFDARGCGRSSRTPPYSVATCVADLEAIRRHYGIERWVVAGHSWGADLALIYALHEPQRVLGFACIAGGRLHNDREWHEVYTQRHEQGLERELDFSYPPNMEVNAQVNQSWKQYIQRPSLLKALSQLDRPALFLYGERDIRPAWPVEQVAQLLPQARFEHIAGADHYIWESHADVLQTRLRDFIGRVAA
jgi:proline iminopeptidase